MRIVLAIGSAIMLLLAGAGASDAQDTLAVPGADAMAAAALQADPAGEYVVGVDDILDVSMIKPESIAGTVTVAVAPDGAITVPYIGNVHAKGLTLPKIQDEVQRRLGDGYVEFPVVSVSLRQTRSKKCIVYGEVNKPGAYPVEDGMTLLHAVTVAGGLIAPGAMGRVTLMRPKAGGDFEVTESDIATVLREAAGQAGVLPGDSIIVTVERIYVSGDVGRPGAYPAEERMSLLHAITVAGGFSQTGATGKVKLLRAHPSPGEPAATDLGLAALLRGAHAELFALPGDTITVTADKFFISGEVSRPGAYPVEEGMTLLHAITVAGGFSDAGATGRAKLLRALPMKGEPGVIEAKLDALLRGAEGQARVRSGDAIVVSADTFYIYGEVARPGMYPLRGSTTAFTAISMAGGFTKFGSGNRVKILRPSGIDGRYDTVQVNINEVISSGGSKADVQLRPGDVVVASEGMF
jgi:polysaccharide export outer membrane protein